MLRTLLIVAAIGLGDSLNPSTVVPAAYLAVMPAAVRRVLEFSAGVFVAYVLGGILLLLGPGQLLLATLPQPGAHKRHLLEVGGGALLLAIALIVWLTRRRLAELAPPGARRGRRGSAFAAGAAVMVAELPTAFPYFGAIAVIISSGSSLGVQLLMLLMFNLLFVAPLIAIASVVATSSRTRTALLEPVAGWLTRHWPTIFATLAFALGAALVVGGAVGLAHD